MIKKISIFAAFGLIVCIVLSFTLNSGMDKRRPHPIINISGDEPPVAHKNITINPDAVYNEPVFTYSDSIISFTDVATGEASLYDLQSNGTTQHCWQNPASPDDIHLVFMWNQTSGIPAEFRRTKYVVSNDRGATWLNIGEIPSGASAGFVACHGLDDGRIVLTNHSSPTGVVRNHVFVEVSAGTGTFNTFDPGTDPSLQKIWPRLTTTSGTPGKVVVVASQNTAAATVGYTNSLILPGGTFTGFVGNPDLLQAEQYALDRAANGTIGLAYIRNDFVIANTGDVRYIFSTNDGLTWSAPVTVYEAAFAPEFYGALRGIDIVFQGNDPKVTFDLVKYDESGGFYPAICSKVMFWSPSINGGVALPVADSTNHPCVFLGERTPDDVFTNVCRGSIGRSSDGVYLWVAYNVARAERFDSVNYYDVYFAWSTNNGATWGGRQKITNTSGPIRDCRYPSISPTNDLLTGYYYANIEYQNDSIPGSHVNGSAASLAKQRFIRVKLLFPIGIQNIGSEVPRDFSLHQNYPNPFNPSTKIRFELPVSEKVTLKLYDATGKEIATLINEQLTAGIKEYEYNAVNLPSGVYFYTITAGDFKDTKKMVLLK